MGRTWIVFGKPESRAQFKGYSQLYPTELWMYFNKTGSPSLPSFFYVLFFMDGDIGDFRHYHPVVDGPMKLVRGSQFRSNRDVYEFLKRLGGDLAHAAFSLSPSDPLDADEFRPSIAGEMLLSRVENFANDPYQLERLRQMRSLQASVKSQLLLTQQHPLALTAIALRDPAGEYWVD